MSLNFNRVTLAGNLTRDPDLKRIGEHRVVASFTLAINRYWRGEDGERREETTFVDCEAWGRTAEILGQYLNKGSNCLVEGRLRQDQWQDSSGKRISRMKILVEQIQFGGTRQGATQPSDQAATYPPSAPSGQRVNEGPSLEESFAAGAQALSETHP
ncbi:MAG: single-stranded DNA-binding protein [Planctomycetota bacterium]|nr:MAG: single-stranded DNA-binding protein [Planctomycetota bacterium]